MPKSLCSPTAVPADPMAWQAEPTALRAARSSCGSDGSEEDIPGKTSVRLRSGERVRIESPGGGGWGQSNS